MNMNHCDTDLLVIGATPGGVACAVRAAREGLRVILTSPHGHLGGMLSSGLGGWEAPYDGLRCPIMRELRLAAEEHYRSTYGEGSPQHRSARPDPSSRRHIRRPRLEPRVADLIFERLVAQERQITVLRHTAPLQVERDGRLIRSVTLGEPMTGIPSACVRAQSFADATYEGDLLALAGTAYRVGRESRATYGEPHAGVVYCANRPPPPGLDGWPREYATGVLPLRFNPHAASELLPGSTGEADPAVMAYNFRTILTDDPDNRVPMTEPPGYDPALVRGVGWNSLVPEVQNRKISWNGGRLIGPHTRWPEASWPERAAIYRLYRERTLMLLWYLQHDPEIPEATRSEWSRRGLARDEFTDNGHFPHELYVREARRLVGRHVFTEHDGIPAPGLERPPLYADSIAMTDWPLDSVSCTDRSSSGFGPEGAFFLSPESRPAQVPYRSLLPQDLDNLLVPVCLSSSHVGWGSLRLEPVWLQTGEAAGVAAAMALQAGVPPAAISGRRLVGRMARLRSQVCFFSDLDSFDQGAHVPAALILGACGLLPQWACRPEDPLTRATAEAWGEVVRNPGLIGDDTTDLAKRIVQAESDHSSTPAAAEAMQILGVHTPLPAGIDPAGPMPRRIAFDLVADRIAGE